MGNCGCVTKAPEEQEQDMDEQLIKENPSVQSRPSLDTTKGPKIYILQFT